MKQISTWHFRGLFWSEDAGAPKVPSGKGLGAKENGKVGAKLMRLENLLDAGQLRWGRMFGLLALLVLATIAGAQQQESPSVKPGTVSGSVFLITKGGDLKPARMIHVVLLYTSQTGQSDEAGAVGTVWLGNLGKALAEFNQQVAAERRDPAAESAELARILDAKTCIKRLSLYNDVFMQTITWAHSANKDSQTVLGHTDENGTFNLTVPQPGNYIIVATGYAGLNDAFWQAGVPDRIVVSAGANTAVKLPRPEEACLVQH